VHPNQAVAIELDLLLRIGGRGPSGRSLISCTWLSWGVGRRFRRRGTFNIAARGTALRCAVRGALEWTESRR
jgi:hypothetical protein